MAAFRWRKRDWSFGVRTFLDPVRAVEHQGFPAAALCANSATCVGYPHWKPLKACLGNDLRRILATSHHANLLPKHQRPPSRPGARGVILRAVAGSTPATTQPGRAWILRPRAG